MREVLYILRKRTRKNSLHENYIFWNIPNGCISKMMSDCFWHLLISKNLNSCSKTQRTYFISPNISNLIDWSLITSRSLITLYVHDSSQLDASHSSVLSTLLGVSESTISSVKSIRIANFHLPLRLFPLFLCPFISRMPRNSRQGSIAFLPQYKQLLKIVCCDISKQYLPEHIST